MVVYICTGNAAAVQRFTGEGAGAVIALQSVTGNKAVTALTQPTGRSHHQGEGARTVIPPSPSSSRARGACHASGQ